MPLDPSDLSVPLVKLTSVEIALHRDRSAILVVNAYSAALSHLFGREIRVRWDWTDAWNDQDVVVECITQLRQSEVTVAAKLWEMMRDRYSSVLVGASWRVEWNKVSTYAKMPSAAFATTFAERVRGKT